MSFSRQASITAVPLLSRLVLAAAFIPAGWDKILGDPVTFIGEEAEILQRLGVGASEPTQVAGVAQDVLGTQEEPEAVPDAEPQAEPQEEVDTGRLRDRIRPRTPDPNEEADPGPAVLHPPPRPPPKTEPDPDPPLVEPPPPPPPAAKHPDPPSQSVAGGTVVAKPLYRVAIMLVSGDKWPESWKPQWMAWAAAGAELIGGALILVGLFSRLWALGLVITMGFAFYLTSTGMVMPALSQWPPLMPMAEFNQVFTQLSLLVLALCVMLTGAGKLSVDGLLFGDGGDDDEHLLHLG